MLLRYGFHQQRDEQFTKFYELPIVVCCKYLSSFTSWKDNSLPVGSSHVCCNVVTLVKELVCQTTLAHSFPGTTCAFEESWVLYFSCYLAIHKRIRSHLLERGGGTESTRKIIMTVSCIPCLFLGAKIVSSQTITCATQLKRNIGESGRYLTANRTIWAERHHQLAGSTQGKLWLSKPPDGRKRNFPCALTCIIPSCEHGRP